MISVWYHVSCPLLGQAANIANKNIRHSSRNVNGQGLSFRPFTFSHVCRLPSSLSEFIYLKKMCISLGLNIAGNIQDNVGTQLNKLLYITKALFIRFNVEM